MIYRIISYFMQSFLFVNIKVILMSLTSVFSEKGNGNLEKFQFHNFLATDADSIKINI